MTQEKIPEFRTQKLPSTPSKRRWILIILGGILLTAWFALGYYLHMQEVQIHAKVEQNRIEAQRREELRRRGAQYRQSLQQTQTPGARNIFDGR